MSKTIVITTTDNKLTGDITPSDEVTVASTVEIQHQMSQGVSELVASLAEDFDPTKKKCSRCFKMGRMPYHPIEDFSLLKSGKRLSQCRTCRTEQSDKWCKLKAEHRRAYHREYQKLRPKMQKVSSGVKELMDMYKEDNNSVKRDAKDALLTGQID